MKSLLLVLLLASAVVEPADNQHKAPAKGKLLKTVQCRKVPTEVTAATGLDCGVDENGEALILDIPETVYQFPRGESFTMYIFDNGEDFPPDHQPKGSKVIKTPPCQPVRPSHMRQALNPGPCNPDALKESPADGRP
jgi:hypothetical protein